MKIYQFEKKTLFVKFLLIHDHEIRIQFAKTIKDIK